MAHRHISTSDQCPICTSTCEYFQHLFRDCATVQVAWTIRNLHIDPRLNGHIAFTEWLINWILYFRKEDGPAGDHLPRFVGLLWSIWGVRNDHIFRQQQSTLARFTYRFQETQHQHTMFIQDRGSEGPCQSPPHPLVFWWPISVFAS